MKQYEIQSVTDISCFCCSYFWNHMLFFASLSCSLTLPLKFTAGQTSVSTSMANLLASAQADKVRSPLLHHPPPRLCRSRVLRHCWGDTTNQDVPPSQCSHHTEVLGHSIKCDHVKSKWNAAWDGCTTSLVNGHHFANLPYSNENLGPLIIHKFIIPFICVNICTCKTLRGEIWTIE